MAADSNFLRNLGVLGQTPLVPSKRGPVRPSQPDADFMQNINAFGSPSASKPAATAPADQSFMQNLNAFSSSPRAEDPMAVMMREAGRTDVNRGLLDDGSFGFKDVYGRPLVDGKVQSSSNVALVPDSTISTVYNGRNDPRVSATGVPQTGTNMNRSFNDLLATTNTSRYQPFSSSQLPETQGNPFSATPSKTLSFDEPAPGITGNAYDNYGAAGGAANVSRGELAQKDEFNPNAARIEGGSSRKVGGSLSDALADTAGINSYMSKFSSGDQERAANRAFLDTRGSMEGLRAKEAVNNVVYAGGQHYMSGKSGDDKAIGIDRTQARDISNGVTTAKDLLSAHLQRAKDSQSKSPAELQDPMTTFGNGLNISVSKPGAGGFNLEKEDFKLNNEEGGAGFETSVDIGNKKGNAFGYLMNGL